MRKDYQNEEIDTSRPAVPEQVSVAAGRAGELVDRAHSEDLDILGGVGSGEQNNPALSRRKITL